MSHIIKILIHSDAVYLRYHPHRIHPPIVNSLRCVDLAAERATLMQQQQIPKPVIIKKKSNRSVSTSSSSSSSSTTTATATATKSSCKKSVAVQIDTGCTFSDFEIGDVVMAWYNDDFNIATIRESDCINQLFTLEFDDQTESPDYEPREMKHLS